VPISRYDEFKIMRTHAKIGSEAISVAERELGENSFLHFASEIAISHHEKWDGSGYPRRLNGNNIPVSGRLMAVADVYDALISKRVYKPAFSHDKAMNIMREGNAKHFDPDMIDALNACEHEFIEISKQFHDEHTEMVRIVSPLFSN
jgi:response regulator RpfG family c-di-GMP phosphodiesterase